MKSAELRMISVSELKPASAYSARYLYCPFLKAAEICDIRRSGRHLIDMLQ